MKYVQISRNLYSERYYAFKTRKTVFEKNKLINYTTLQIIMTHIIFKLEEKTAGFQKLTPP